MHVLYIAKPDELNAKHHWGIFEGARCIANFETHTEANEICDVTNRKIQATAAQAGSPSN